jgi:hypothetical protein
VGPEITRDLARWRPYVDITEGRVVPAGWSPEKEHDRLLALRRFHARCLYQYTLLLALAKESKWECVMAMEAFRTACLIELRSVEIDLARYQMMCRLVGVPRTVSKEKVYAAGTFCHSLQLFLTDALARARGTKKYERRSAVGDAPLRSETFSELCDGLHAQLYAVQMLLKGGMAQLRLHWSTLADAGELEARHLAARMTLAVRALDTVLAVNEEE